MIGMICLDNKYVDVKRVIDLAPSIQLKHVCVTLYRTVDQPALKTTSRPKSREQSLADAFI